MAGIAPTNAVTPSPAGVASSSGGNVSPSTGSGSVTPIEAGISGAPDKIQQLTRQIQVGGVISQLPDSGQITVNTALGALRIVLPQLTQDQQQKLEQQLLALFQSQKPLTIVVQPGDPPTQALLLLPPSTSSGETGLPTTSATPSAPTNFVLPPPLVPGAVLPAVVLLPVDGTAAGNLASIPAALSFDELAQKAQTVADQSVAQQPAEILSGSPAATPLSGALTSAAQNPESSLANPVSAARASGTLTNLLQPGTQLSLNVNSVTPPSLPPPVASLPNQITATVIGSGPGGQLLLKAGDATLYVQQPANIPVGSTLLVTVTPARLAPPVLVPVPDIGNFGALQQALATIAQTDPALARQLMESIIPQPNPALAGALFLLFSAFQQGDLRGWLGPSAADILGKAGKMEIATKLAQALTEGGQAVHDPVVGTWRSYPLPLFNNGEFQLLNFYVHGDRSGRGHGGPDDEKSAAKSVRFLIDMRLSKLGAIQLDGFVRPKLMDMIVRSETGLPPGLDRDLRQTYANTLSAIDYAGTLSFQNGRQNWLFMRNAAAAGSVEA